MEILSWKLNFSILLILFYLKHFVADFIFQNEKIATQKGKKINILLLHSTHHGILSFLILIFFVKLQIAFFFLFIEILFHSLIDFLKANEKLLGRYKYPSKLYFVFFGLDQMMHNIFYIISTFFLLYK